MKGARRKTYTMLARADGMAATRDRIVHDMLQLALEQAYEDITLAAIAQAADVSHQTVLNHFDSKEGVAAAAAELLAQQTGEARAKARPGDVKGAIGVLVGEYERIGDAQFVIVRAYDELCSPAAATVQALTRKIAIFVGPDYLITVHRKDQPSLFIETRGWVRRSAAPGIS